MRWTLAIIGCLALVALAVYLGVWASPASREGGQAYRLIYLHLPLAVNTLVAFTVAAAASLLVLLRRGAAADRWARAAMSAALLLGTAMLASGMLWAWLAWGHWWDFKSPRLLLALVLWILIIVYSLLRGGLPEGARQQKVAAVYCLIAWLDVPLVYLSTRLVGTDIHPASVVLDDPLMKLALATAFAAATAVGALLLAAFLRRTRTAERPTPDA